MTHTIHLDPPVTPAMNTHTMPRSAEPMGRWRSLTGFVALLTAAVLTIGLLGAARARAAALPVPYSYGAEQSFWLDEFFAPTTLAGANNGCRPTSQHPYPVILVHGTFEDEASNWLTLAPLLANNGYCVYALNYGETSLSLGGRIDGFGEIAASAHDFAAFVNQVLAETGARQVDIVGHSLGGTMPLYYLKFLGGAAKVHELIGLAPMNHGTTLDGIALLSQLFPQPQRRRIVYFLNEIGAPSLPEQEVNSSFMTNLFASGDTVPGPRYVVIETKYDGLLTPYTNAFLNGPNVANILIQDQCPQDMVGDQGISFDGPTTADVLNELSQSPNPSYAPPCTNLGPPGYLF